MRTDGHADSYTATDSRGHYHRKSAALDFVDNLLVQTIELSLNLRFIAAFRKDVRNIPEAVQVENRLMKHVKVRMFADHLV